MKLALLPTDWLIWAVVLVTLVWSIRMRAHPMLMENWRKVFLKPSAMVSGLVLASFVCIALLDSMRWVDPSRPGDNALSALDRALAPLVQARERRYSAPLAYVSFRKESMERDGQTVRDYPRLQFGGAQLQNPQTEWFGDVLER
ncbi:MAG: ABC transporter permease, partial [Betaproteobacteria bacterium]|nr:ABC transporter permease [Betaproteobacteria bacterium]